MKENVFESEHIVKSIFRLSLPAVLSGLITIIYNLTDMFFIGKTGDPNQVVAISLSIPVALILMSLGAIFGIGGGSLISRLLGSKNYATVKVVSSLCCYLSLVAGLIYNLVIVFFMESILHLMGTTVESAGLTKSYLLSISCGSYFTIFSVAFCNVLRSEGASKEAMFGVLIGNVLNMILDPIFILILNLGVLGAGIATVIGNIVTSLFFVRYILKTKTTYLSISIKHLRFRGDLLYEILSVGFPASLDGFSMCVAHIFLNNFVSKYGAIAVASIGIATRAFLIIPIIQIGFSQGVQPLIGYNYAALRRDKMRKIIFTALKISFVVGLFLSGLFFIFAENISRIFIDNDEVLKVAPKFLKIISVPGVFIGLFFIYLTATQSIGKAWPSLILSITRQGLIYIPALFINDYLFGLTGVVSTQPISDLFAFIFSLIIFLSLKEFRKQNA